MVEDMTCIAVDAVFEPPNGRVAETLGDLQPLEGGDIPRVSSVDDLQNGFELMYVAGVVTDFGCVVIWRCSCWL